MEFSPDGKLILIATSEQLVLWNRSTGVKMKTFRIGDQTATQIAAMFLPDGKHVLTGQADGARLWDVQTGSVIRAFPGTVDLANGDKIQLSADGSYLLVNDVDESYAGEVNLWAVQTGEKLFTFRYPVDLSFTPDSKKLLVLQTDTNAGTNEQYLWNIETHEKVRSFPTTLPISNAVFSPDGKYFLAQYASTSIELWDTENAVKLHTFEFDHYLSGPYGFFPDSRRALITDQLSDGKNVVLVVWDVFSNHELKTFATPYVELNQTVFSQDGKYLLFSDPEPIVGLLDMESGKQVRKFC